MTDSAMDNEDLQEDNEDMTCTICLEPFQLGEDICFSRHLKCHHCFHSDCLIPWLKNNDDCPMCRTILIDDTGEKDDFVDDDSIGDDDGDGFTIANGLVTFVRTRLGATRTNEDGEEESPGFELVERELPTESGEEEVNTRASKSRRKKDKRNYNALPSNDHVTADEAEIVNDLEAANEVV